MAIAQYNPYPLWGFYSISARNGCGKSNQPVDPGSIQGSHRPIAFIRIKQITRANDFFVKLSNNDHIVGLVHENHIINEI